MAHRKNPRSKNSIEGFSFAPYGRIGLIRARQHFELIFHLHTRLIFNANDDDEKHLETMYAFESGNPTQNDTSRVIHHYPKISRQFNGLKNNEIGIQTHDFWREILFRVFALLPHYFKSRMLKSTIWAGQALGRFSTRKIQSLWPS